MAASGTFAKKSLGTARVHVSDARAKGALIKTSAFWKIDNFYMIKDNINYTSFYEPKGWTLSLHKKRKVLTVAVDIRKERLLVECCVAGSSTSGGDFAICDGRNEGIYERSFRTKDYADTPLMGKGTLLLVFIISELWTRVCASTRKRSKDDLKHVSEDLLHTFSGLIACASHDNFALHGENYVLPVHKSVLAARSTFFSTYLRVYPDREEFKLNINYTILCQIIGFMYTGEVRLSETWQSTESLFESAVQLGVTRLWFTIALHLLQIINEDNVHEIRVLGMKTRVKRLVEAADTFLECVCEEKRILRGR